MPSEPRVINPIIFYGQEGQTVGKDFRAMPAPPTTFQKEVVEPVVTFTEPDGDEPESDDWPPPHSDEAPVGEVADDDDPEPVEPEFLATGPAPD